MLNSAAIPTWESHDHQLNNTAKFRTKQKKNKRTVDVAFVLVPAVLVEVELAIRGLGGAVALGEVVYDKLHDLLLPRLSLFRADFGDQRANDGDLCIAFFFFFFFLHMCASASYIFNYPKNKKQKITKRQNGGNGSEETLLRTSALLEIQTNVPMFCTVRVRAAFSASPARWKYAMVASSLAAYALLA